MAGRNFQGHLRPVSRRTTITITAITSSKWIKPPPIDIEKPSSHRINKTATIVHIIRLSKDAGRNQLEGSLGPRDERPSNRGRKTQWLMKQPKRGQSQPKRGQSRFPIEADIHSGPFFGRRCETRLCDHCVVAMALRPGLSVGGNELFDKLSVSDNRFVSLES